MLKIANGAVNEDHVSAVLQRGPNWELILESGQGLVVSEADAQEIMKQLGVKPAPAPSKP
jgi:hypothetical protein